MKAKAIDFEHDEFSFNIDEKVAILRFKKDIFSILSDTERSGYILNLCEWVEKDPVINALAFFNDKDALTELEYGKFLNLVFGKENHKEKRSGFEINTKLIRARQLNTFRQFILKMVDYKKLYISCLQGEVVTPFLGTSLVADFRIIAEDTKFMLTHVKFGVHPAGALPFYLTRFIGEGKAMEYLLKGGVIDARQALEMSLVNTVLPVENFEKAAMEEVKKLAEINPVLIRLTKRLYGNFKEDLEHYFNIEAKMLGF